MQKAFFGPFQVSVMLDSNGCNTTAATTIARIAKAREPRRLPRGRARPRRRRPALGRAAGQGGLRGRRVRAPARPVRRRSPVPPRRTALSVREGARPRRPRAGRPRRARGAARRGADRPVRRARRREVLRSDFWAAHDTIELLADYNAADPLGHRGHEGDRRPQGLRRQARARRAGDRRSEDEGAQGLRAAAVREQRPGARHRRRLRDRQGVSFERVSRAIDPGTVSFDVCVLDAGEVVLERSFRDRRRGRRSGAAGRDARWTTARSRSCSVPPATGCRSFRSSRSASASSR